MTDVLSILNSLMDMKMDDIEDVRPRNNRQQQPQVNPLNHYEVEAHGTTLLSTENKEEAIRVYRDSQDTDKKVMRIWNGKRFQYLPRGFY